MRTRYFGLLALVLFATAAPVRAAQLWVIEGLQPLNLFVSSDGTPSSDGTKVFGETKTGGVYRPAYWTAQNGLTEVDSPLPDGYDQVRLRGISPDGTRMTGVLRGPTVGSSAFLWSASTGYQLIENDPDLNSFGNDVSAAGDVVGGFGTDTQPGAAFRWSASGGFVELDARSQPPSEALVISDNGNVIAGVDDGSGDDHYMAVAWPENGEHTQLIDDDRPKAYGEASAISADGTWIAGSHGFGNTFELFRWSADKGAELLGVGLDPTSITDDGRTIAGSNGTIWTEGLGNRSVSDSLMLDLGVNLPANVATVTVSGMTPDGLFVAGDLFATNGGPARAYLASLAKDSRPGDFNFDRLVNLDDFGVLKENFGKGKFLFQGDANFDRKVDLNDFGVLKEAWGRNVPAAVPEPATATLALFAATIVGGLRRRLI